MFIFARFEKLRSSRGVTKAYIASALSRTPTLIQDWKQGKSEPSDEQLAIVAEILHTTPAYLLGETDNPDIVDISISRGEVSIIKKYRTLDERGKRMVDMVLDAEAKEVEADEPENIVEFPQTKDIPLFEDTFAAGRGDVGFSNLFVNYAVPIDSRAEFAIRVNGNSMEPYLPDGSIALCRKEKPHDGDVGAFLLDGAYVCKQVCVDIRGTVHLFSLNRDRSDADQSIEYEDSAERLFCFGTVIMDKRVPLPLD